MDAKGEKQVYCHSVHLYIDLHPMHFQMVIYIETGKTDFINTGYASESCGIEKSKGSMREQQESIKTFTDQTEDHGIHLLSNQLEKVIFFIQVFILKYFYFVTL